jgi:hypothetical protein
MAFGHAQHLTILFEIGSSGSCLRRGLQAHRVTVT